METAASFATAPHIDKPYGIAQIRAYIPVRLDLKKLNYDVWRELFETHCSSFGVLGHIDGSSAPSPDDEKQWKERDGLVKMWIYGTVSEQLLDTILKAKSTARDLWLTLENLFRDNKEAQSIQYDNELRTLVIGDMSVTDYTHKLKTIADLLANLDTPVTDRALVMHMHNGLSDKFDSIINVIQHHTPFPSFIKARSMLLMEEKRLTKQVKPTPEHNTDSSSPSVMYTNSNAQPPSQQTFNNNNSANSGRNNNNNYNKNRGRGGRNGRGRGRYNNQWHNNPYVASPWSYQHQQAPWMFPQSYTQPQSFPPSYYPPPFPAPSGQPGSFSPRQQGEVHYTHSAPLPGNSPPFVYTALPQAFSTMTLQDPSQTPWVMDSGATNHVTAEPRSTNLEQTPLLQ